MKSKATIRGAAAGALTSHQLNAARLELLRRRFSVFAAVIGTLVVVKSVLVGLVAVRQGLELASFIPPVFAMKIALGLSIIALPHFHRRWVAGLSRRQLVGAMSVLVVLAVFTQVPGAGLLGRVLTEIAHSLGSGVEVGALPPLLVILTLVYSSAALIVPWSVREAVTPLLAMVLIVAVGTFALTNSVTSKATNSLLVLLAGSPGLLISWWRYSRWRERLTLAHLTGRYRTLQQELKLARRIHERLFPEPSHSGPVRFAYSYEPARQIGGDYVDVVTTPDGACTVVLLDVTGHGIAAALAVNRLHGEIKRTLAENAQATPCEIIMALNRYIRLTLADEYVFATAVALRVDPRTRSLTLCSAGHPAALVRRADRTVVQLEATTAMLGILDGESFAPGEHTTFLAPGDAVLAFTDGAIERYDSARKMLGIERLAKSFEQVDGDAPDEIIARLRRDLSSFRALENDDDTLILCLDLNGKPHPARE